MAIAAQRRGTDASGYAVIGSSGLIEISKKAIPAKELLINTDGSPIFIGHTRFATMGDPASESQAHPFLSKDKRFALTHNGVAAFDFEKISEQIDLNAEIDSEGILRYLEVVGFDRVGITKLFENWENSGFAIAILDRLNLSLTLFRNDVNPLVLARTAEDVILYGSTDGIILRAARAANLHVKWLTTIEPGIRYEFFLSGKSQSDRLFEIDKESA